MSAHIATEYTITPVLVSAGGGATAAPTIANGDALRTGNRVSFQVALVLNGLGTLGAGALTISGLPVAHKAGTLTTCSVYLNTGAAGLANIVAFIAAGASVITLQKFAAGAANSLLTADITGTTTILVSGTYVTA